MSQNVFTTWTRQGTSSASCQGTQFCFLMMTSALLVAKNKSKHHVSLVVCDNAIGTHTIPYTLIGNQASACIQG